MRKTQNKKIKSTAESWPIVKLGEVCKTGRGRVISKKEIEANHGTYPVYSSQTKNNGILGRINSYDFEGELVTWTTDGANAGTVFYRDGKFNCTNVCGTIKPRPDWRLKIDLRFIALALGRVAKKYVITASGNPKIMNNVVERIPIPLPPLKIQKQIVAKVEACFKAIDKVEADIVRVDELLEKSHKSFMQQSLSGQLPL